MSSADRNPVRSLLGVTSKLLLALVASATGALGQGVYTPPSVAFEAIDLNGPGVEPEYYTRHVRAGDGQFILRLQLSRPAGRAGVDVAYILDGDAVRGRDYFLLPGSESPLQIAYGARSADLQLLFPQRNEYFEQRTLSVRIDEASSQAKPDPQADEVWLRVRCAAAPPSIMFRDPSSSGGRGMHQVQVGVTPQAAPSEEPLRVFWRQANEGLPGAAVRGLDFNWLPGWASGSVAVHGRATIPFEVRPGARDGLVLVLALDHERSDRSDENLVTYTHDLRLEGTSAQAPGQPAWPTEYILGPSSVLHSGPPPLTVIHDLGRLHPVTREPLYGLILSPGAADTAYHRKSFEDEVHCAGPVQLLPLQRFMRWSQYVELPSSSSQAIGQSRFVRMSLRDREANEAHAVIFDRESPDGGLLGSRVSTPTGEWGVHGLKGWNTSSDFGVALEDGRTRLWLTYNETDAQRIGNVTSRILYPVWFGSDGTYALVGGPDENVGKGLLFYDPLLEASADLLSGPPGRFWEKRASWWAPRGGATIDAGGANMHRFVIALP